jgi:DNA-binding SARP family transcriptional activator
LRQTLLVIRAALEPHGIDVLRTVGDSVSLDPAGLRVDARLFERLLERGTPESIRVGVCLYRGDFLEGLNVGEPAFDLWATTRRIHLRQRAIEALEGALEHLTLKGRVHEAIHCALDLLAIEPLLESAHRALIRLYANSGQVGAALRQYDTCARDLDAELHVSPEAETVNLVREIRSRGRAHAGIPVTPVLTQSRRTRHPQRG